MFGLFEGWDPDDISVIKTFALDSFNLLFVYGGYRLAKAARKKQDIYFENGGSSEMSYSDCFVWVVSFAMGLIVAYAFPSLFNKIVIDPFFHTEVGPLGLLTSYVLCLNVIYIMIRGIKIVLPIGRFAILVVLPIFLILGHFYG